MSDATDTEQSEETPALPGDGLREGIVDALRDDLGEHLLDTHLVPQDDLWVRVSAEAWALTAQALKAQGFEYFCFVSAIDWMPSPYGKGEDNPDDEPKPLDTEIKQGYAGGDTRFQVFARLTDLRRHVGVTIKADVPESMTMPTWIGSFAGANWHERETHEMFGIGFDGHPDLRNLYLPGEFEGYPLRKDFPLLSRMVKPWPGIVDVEPMPEFAEEIGDTPISADGEPLPVEAAGDAEKTADTAAGDAVEAATAPDGDADRPATATDESATATVVDTPPTDGDAAGDVDGETAAVADAVDAADATDDAVEPDGEPATGPVADTIITDDGAEPDGETPDDSDGEAPVTADLGSGTVTESTDADPAAPTPGDGVADAEAEQADDREGDAP